MCRFKLDVCPYPHKDPISALIFIPGKLEQWEECQRIRPWGRLSCGNLTVEHAVRLGTPVIPDSFANVHAPVFNSSPVNNNNDPTAFPAPRRRSSTDTTIVPEKKLAVRSRGECCPWCTAVLKTVATKSKDVQKGAQGTITKLEEAMNQDAEWKGMQQDIAERMKDVDKMKHVAWRKAREIMEKKVGNDQIQG